MSTVNNLYMFDEILIQLSLHACFFHRDISVILSLRHFGHCEISVCPIVVLDVTVFTSLYYPTL